MSPPNRDMFDVKGRRSEVNQALSCGLRKALLTGRGGEYDSEWSRVDKTIAAVRGNQTEYSQCDENTSDPILSVTGKGTIEVERGEKEVLAAISRNGIILILQSAYMRCKLIVLQRRRASIRLPRLAVDDFNHTVTR